MGQRLLTSKIRTSAAYITAAVVVVQLLFHAALATCNLPILPTDLDLITSVEATHHREVHLQGMYRIGLDTYSVRDHAHVHNLTLSYTEAQEIRVSLLPHDALSLDVVLIHVPTDKMVACSMAGGRGAERMIFALLDAAETYQLMFRYTFGWSTDKSDCPSVMMELAAQPASIAPSFKEACLAASGTVTLIPAVSPDSAKDYYYEYRTPEGSVAWIDLTDKGTSSHSPMAAADDEVTVGSTTVVVPYIPGRHQKWKFTASIQSRFLDGGDLALMLTPFEAHSRAPTLHECANSTSLCVWGTRALRNQYLVQTTLWPDLDSVQDKTYTLWIVRRRAPAALKRTCVPASFHVTLFPLHEEESFVTCPQDPLPETFHMPGLYDNLTGVMFFSQSLLVNLTTRFQEVRLQPTVPGTSLMRASLGAHDDLDIDLILLERNADGAYNTAASSTAVEGPEGIVFPLSSDREYILRVSIPFPFRQFDGKDHDYYHFCDTYDLTVHVFPAPPPDHGTASVCDRRPPIFATLQETLNETHQFEFGIPNLKIYSFTHPINVHGQIQQMELASLRFYIPADALMMSMIVYSDAFSGTVEMQLIDEDAEEDGSDDDVVVYSTRRAVGSSITKELEMGWYKLRLLSPYVQTTSKTFDSLFSASSTFAFPTCLQYNVLFRIQPRNSCLNALQLPEEYPTTAHLHRHVADTYEIPIDGRHFMSIQPEQDVLMHVLIAASDYALKLYLFDGTTSSIVSFSDLGSNVNVMGIGMSVFGDDAEEPHTKLELVAKLSALKSYTLVFDFREAEEWDGAFFCASFELEMSIAKLTPLSDSDANDCSQYDELPEDADLGTLTLPFVMPPTIYAVHPRGDDASRTLAPFREWSIAFTITERANIRVNVEYDFPHHSFGLLLCMCDENSDCNSCEEADGYFNGLEIPAAEIPAGSFVLFMKPWTMGVLSVNAGDDLYINFCTYIAAQIVIAPLISSNQPPALCSAMLQYLPPSLNNVAYLSPLYNDETHFLQNVLISTQHIDDKTTFTISEPSILRVLSPAGLVLMDIAVVGVDNDFRQDAFGTKASLYLELNAGQYELRVRFFVHRETLKASACQSVPLEVSIMTVEDITDVSVDSALCKGSLPFPVKPFFHGHDTLYRSPGVVPFSHQIDFPIGELGGTAEFDVRYNFETSGLQVRFWGEQVGSGASTSVKTFSWAFFSDRAFLSTALSQGKYHLVIEDPITSYGNKTVARCIPYSIHLRTNDLGNYSMLTPTPVSTRAPAGGGDDGSSAAPPPPPLTLSCDSLHTDPFPTSFRKFAWEELFSYSSSSLVIPFDRAEDVKIRWGTHDIPMKLTKHVISFDGRVTQAVRVWLRTSAKVFTQVRLYDDSGSDLPGDDAADDATDDDAVARSVAFGYQTQSLYFPIHTLSTNDDDSVDISTRTIRMEICFYYREAPVYLTDYEDCNTKRRLTTFELYVALLDEDAVTVATQCNATQSDMTPEQRLPPLSVTLSNRGTFSASGSAFVTTDDLLEQSTSAPHYTRPPTRIPSPGSPGSGSTQYLPPASSPFGARQMQPAAVDEVAGISDEMRGSIDIVISTSFTVPSGAYGVRLMFHVKYPLNYVNLHTSLRSTNQTAVLVEGYGVPQVAHDEKYQGESIIELTGKTLGPGTYTLSVLLANVLQFNRRQMFCIPFHWSLHVISDYYPETPSSTPPPATPAPRPRLLDISPRSDSGLDVSDPLEITFTLSEDASMTLPRGVAFALLQRNDNGAQVLPSARYFIDTDQLVVVFGSLSLDWGVTYHLVLDANALQTASGGVYDLSDADASSVSFSTATCGCEGGFCVATGGCQCVEPDGETCNTCPEGYELSRHGVQLGVGSLATTRRICELSVATPAPLTFAPPPRGATPAPRSTPESPPPFSPAPTPGTEATEGPAPAGSATSAPATTAGTATPLRSVRYVLGYALVLMMVVYTAMFALRFRKRAQRSLLERNPFRAGGAASGRSGEFGSSMPDDDDDDEDDEGGHNMPVVK